MFVSVHIPKCAGTSFRHVLQEHCGEKLWLNYGAIFVRAQARGELVPSGTEWIHGHFFADAFDDLFPERQLLTWVRDPVERVTSNYYHFLRSPDMRDDCCRELYERKLTLLQFASLDWMRNEMSRYFAGKTVDEFNFVGVAERFDESLRLFRAFAGWSDEIRSRRDNINPDRRTTGYSLSPADRRQIRDLNLADCEIYERATTRLVERLSAAEACVA